MNDRTRCKMTRLRHCARAGRCCLLLLAALRTARRRSRRRLEPSEASQLNDAAAMLDANSVSTPTPRLDQPIRSKPQ